MSQFYTLASLRYTRSLLRNETIFEQSVNNRIKSIDDEDNMDDSTRESREVQTSTLPCIQTRKKFYFWKWLWDVLK